MRIKRKIVLVVLLVLVALVLFITWAQRQPILPPNHYQLSFACNGGVNEERFLFEEADTIVDNGIRRLTSSDAFVIYRIPIDNSELERLYFCTNQVEYHLEFSPDGKEWSTLVRIQNFPGRNPKKFSSQSCGFSPEGRRAASESGSAYLRFRISDELQDSYPAIKYLKLRVSGPSPPQYFHRPSVGREILKNVTGLLPTKLMVLVGLISVIICKRLWKTPWHLFGIGALLWVISVAAKFAFAFVAVKPVDSALHLILPGLAADVIFWIYIGLLTGIFECGIFLLLIKYIRRRKWTWKDAASLGVGFGAVEAIATGIAAAVAAGLNIGMIGRFDLASSLIGSVERLIALTVHTASVAMIIYALAQRKWGWFVASFLYKSGIDAVAAFVALSGIDFLKAHQWFVELGLFGPFAYAGLFILLALKRLWQLQIAEQAGEKPTAEN